jgi:hypothetical protein
MRLLRFFVGQSILLGSGAFVIWMALATHPSGPPDLSLDTLAALGFSILVTAAFLLVVASPLQLIARSFPGRLAAGVLAGPIGVWAGLLLLSSYPVTWGWYVTKVWALHVVYTLVGTAFGWAWWAKLRPNNSSKPTPLRGAA